MNSISSNIINSLFVSLLLVCGLSAEEKVKPKVLKEIVKITENGFNPRELILPKRDASVFFLNVDRNKEYSLEINFGDRRSHCASSELTMGADNWLRTVKPIEYKDFSITCFPDPGEYTLHAISTKNAGKVWKGKILVD